MVKKRSKREIIFDVVEILSSEFANPTKLSMLVNMPYDRFKRLLGALEDKGGLNVKSRGGLRSIC